jgi:transglutaminase-like putative cysteine protease
VIKSKPRAPKSLLESEALTTSRVLALVACLGLVLAPHALHVPLWITLLAGLTMALRAGFAWRGYGLPGQWILALLAVAAAAGTWLSYGMLFGRDAAVALLILMLCLKLMELRSGRDAIAVVFLAYFAVVTNFLYSQTIPMGLYLLGCVWLITAYLIGMQRQAGPRTAFALLRHSAVLLAQATPVMLVLFFLFPRIQGPLWALPHSSASGITGLSDRMAPGSLSNLSLSDEVAFRVQFRGPAPETPKLYWRGPLMWDFDGRTWTVGEGSVGFRRDVQVAGTPLEYVVTLEPHYMRWMFGLDIPAVRPEDGLMTSDFELLSMRPVRTRVRYEMSSYLTYRVGASEAPAILQRALQLPDGFNPRTRALAERLRGEATSPRALVERVLAMFREQPFFYTLAPPELGTHTVDEFLFETRRGFCEHFASSFTFLMRAAGVPARVVTGYQGGVLNPVGGYMIVRQSDAHAWAEVWLPEEGWVRVDPTAAVSPQRIESGVAAAVPAGDPLPLLARSDSAWLLRTRFALDTMTNGWNQWVLGYNHERQLIVMSRLTGHALTWKGVAALLVAGTAIVVALLTIFTLRQNRIRPREPVTVLWNTLSRKLARHDLARLDTEGPRDYIARLSTALPAHAGQLQRIGELYMRLRYESAPAAADMAALKSAVESLKVDRQGSGA